MKEIKINPEAGTLEFDELYLQDTLKLIHAGSSGCPVYAVFCSGNVEYLESPKAEAGGEAEFALDSLGLRRAFHHVHREGSRVFELRIMQDGKAICSEEVRIFNRQTGTMDGKVNLTIVGELVQNYLDQHSGSLKGLKGDKGERGEKGDKGDKGDTGATGAKGEKGDKGERGLQGERGEQGATGEKGAKGDKGEKGLQGERGEKGEKGDKGERGEKGEKGDKGEKGASGLAFTFDDFTEGQLNKLKGQKGDKGERGEKGDTGATGNTGEKGDKGERGEAGKSAFDLAVEKGYAGSIDDWLKSLKGEKGDGLKLDATVKVKGDLSLYAQAEAGFAVGYTETDSTSRETRLYIYVKKTNLLDDWCPPLVITWHDGADGENAKIIEPVKFHTAEKESPSAGSVEVIQNCINFETPYAECVPAGVYIDTENGEQMLPCGVGGITRLVKNGQDIKIYLGTNVPSFQTGKVYFAQGAADFSIYQLYRKNGGKYNYSDFNAKLFELIGEGVSRPEPEPEEPQMYYGYVNDGATYQISQLTEEMLTLETVSAAEAGAKTVTLDAPSGALLFVLVPKKSALTVQKDDGVGGKAAFDEDNGAAGTGANGTEMTFGGTTYLAFGEFNLVDAETIIYIGA